MTPDTGDRPNKSSSLLVSGRLVSGVYGFTLVELLCAMAISGIIITSLGALLMTAGKTIAVLDSRRQAPVENALIALEKLKREAQDSPVFPAIPFEGETDRLAFPQLVVSDGKLKDFRLGQIQNAAAAEFHKVEYYFTNNSLMRRAAAGGEETVLDGLDSVRFSYAVGNPAAGPKAWQDRMPSAGSPERLYALEVRLKPSSRSGRELPEISRTFLLFRRHPLSGDGTRNIGATRTPGDQDTSRNT